MTGRASLQDQAFLVHLFLGEKSSTCSSFKDFADARVCFGRAFEVLVCANLPADFFALFMQVSAIKAP
jgi:hypothetical protein